MHYKWQVGVVVMTSAFHAGDLGSIPRQGNDLLLWYLYVYCTSIIWFHALVHQYAYSLPTKHLWCSGINTFLSSGRVGFNSPYFCGFLSDYVLASKWPPFAIPIHSGCPVYDECSQVKNAIHANLDHSWKISKNFAETCALQILEKSDRVWQNFVKFKRISYNFVLQNLETILFVIYHG